MSRLFADRIRLSVGADRLYCVRLSGWRKARAGEADFALNMQDGAPVFDELSAWLGQKGGRLDVVLSNAWVRYAIVPWQASLSNDRLAEDVARALFIEQYGDIGSGWRIAISSYFPGRARVAVAVDARWMDALHALAQSNNLTLTGVRPALTAVFNCVAKRLPADALLALVEPRRLTLLHIDGGQWRNLHNRMLPERWVNRLPGFITQASVSLGAMTTPLFIVAPQFEKTDIGQLSATWVRLPANRRFNPRCDLTWAMCLGV